MATTDTSNTVVNNSGAAMRLAAAQNEAILKETQDRFLTLLVTQLQNQDPLNPMDNDQITSQMAQLSTVNGINQLNNTLLSLSGQIDIGQSMQATSLIGKSVLIPGTAVKVGSNPNDPSLREATQFGIDFMAPAAKTTVQITDSSGQVLRTIELENQQIGVVSVDWDGKNDLGEAVPDGQYEVKITAVDAEGKEVLAEALTAGGVRSVVYTADGLKLDLGMGKQVSLFDIRKIM
ncbi:flagellar hook capping FlgD N-terminal domain-containing protein [Corticimicrobacter populi]|uniref:Basal-body rod modification protein FlgD n=1 Tax=Corticimicrobacter populi TaxID=2175229 RepID=A0A2V1JTI4_9BURK|nr:flagellar hook capping FlgD N-terminal domain-containing protein [Corticimicrobacter populi]PWF21194.1 flagellar basal body rod modification protein [Corticimicrobacter populi]